MTDFFSLSPEQQLQHFEAAAKDALHHWNLQGASLNLVKEPRENAVFAVEHDSGRYALKLHRLGYHTDDELRSEYQWIQALADFGIKVPSIVPSESGDLFVKQRVAGMSGDIQVDLVEWLDGKELGSVEEGIADEASAIDTYRTVGQLAAQVHNQAVSWQLPPGFVRHAWDEEGLAGKQPIWGEFWKIEAASDAQRDLLVRGRDAVFTGLGQLAKSPGTYSMIHADFAPENILVDGDQLRLIDFDDAGFGWHLFELVTSLYFIQGEPYFDRAQEALVEGYRAHRQLPDQQMELMPLFFLARGFTYIGWVHTRHETETARELTPMLLEAACGLAEDYLSKY
jgi:Ser/Thr protein kinase RdoA (MazF antagonist)